ncbi:MAG: hypothetical protein QOH78_640 [Verrucomicrobiota bacterium]
MNALSGDDRRIPFSLAPTGLDAFFGITQAKAWAVLGALQAADVPSYSP